MNQAVQRILVVGGNGFIGSAICKAALARGIQVTSVSSSGKPYQTAKGHTPYWASKVDWRKGDAFSPESFAHLFPEVGGVVHTLGTLIEGDQYKRAIKEGNIPETFGSFFQSMLCSNGNPLEKGAEGVGKSSYESMNRDAALRVCEAFVSCSLPNGTTRALNAPRPFVYISAEDIFRPIISAKYIKTKREAEQGIENMMANNSDYRGVYIRPSLVYHAHQRPLTTPAAVLLDLSAKLHSKIPPGLPSPSGILRSLAPGSSLESVANALTIPPIHVDHVAEAVCLTLSSSVNPVQGVVGVKRMRELIGWPVTSDYTQMAGV
ncbi:mitochondrial protein [Collybia nuda]|uniref:Mitochondrial protein n=1 Tax=Collybia nuda TaxID=64659 RepID=A0A9P6CG67_9AGAR|nr:mitochondrial protein [Collybia nuda]